MNRAFFKLHPIAAAILAVSPMTAFAVTPADSAYNTDPQHSYVEDRTSEGVEQVNMIMCFMGAMKPDQLVNQGNYIALVDESKCDQSGRDSASNSGANTSASNATEYTTAYVNSTRASNNDPMTVSTWVKMEEQGQPMTIYVNTTATTAPSASDPFGDFRLDYCGKLDATGTSGQCMMNGYIDATSTGLQYYEEGQGGGGSRVIAMTLTPGGDADSGSGAMSMTETMPGPVIVAKNFSFAFNTNYFLRSDPDNPTGVCFSRDASDPDTDFSVWRYGLYNETTGARIDVNSGFPIQYADGTRIHNGFLGYWGLSLPSDVMATLDTGAIIQKMDYTANGATATNYTLVKAKGKLTKYDEHQTTLAAMDKVRFTFGAWSPTAIPGLAGYTQGTQYEMYWDDTAHQFMISGEQQCGAEGCELDVYATPVAVVNTYWPANYGFGLSGWSQAKGGELRVDVNALAADGSNSATVAVKYRTQDIVYPEDFAAIGALYCITDCPTAATLTDINAPFGATANQYGGVVEASLVQYNLDAASGNLRDGTTAIDFTAGAPAGFQWGVRTGKLFPASALGTDAGAGQIGQTVGPNTVYSPWSVDKLATYYVWESGENPWNQFSGVKDGSNNFVRFDPPMSVDYVVPAGAAYGDYAGTSIVLQYGGFGNLWGIPGECVDQNTNEEVSCNTPNARYVPEFMIPQDATAGLVSNNAGNYLVKWLDREIRFAKKLSSDCTDAGLTLPSVTLDVAAMGSSAVDSSSIGAAPAVTNAPRVIHGEVQY